MIGTQIDQDQIEDQFSGHTVLSSGTPMPARTNIDFRGAVTVTDVEGDDTTLIEVIALQGAPGEVGPSGSLSPIDTDTFNNYDSEGLKIRLMAGQTMNFGDVGYILSTSKVAIGVATNLNTSSCAVLCLEETLNTNETGDWLLFGIVRDDSWSWIPGGLLYLTTSGLNNQTMTQTQPTGANEVTQILGVATDTNKILFNPQLIQIEHL